MAGVLIPTRPPSELGAVPPDPLHMACLLQAGSRQAAADRQQRGSAPLHTPYFSSLLRALRYGALGK